MKRKQTAFLGPRYIPYEILLKRLDPAVENEMKKGCKNFLISSHGTMDFFAPYVCLRYINKYEDLKITVKTADKRLKNARHKKFDKTKIDENNFDEFLEDYNNPQRNYHKYYFDNYKPIIDSCDTLICYVDTSKTYEFGPKTALEYAQKQGLKIINLFRVEDGILHKEFIQDKKSKYNFDDFDDKDLL